MDSFLFLERKMLRCFLKEKRKAKGEQDFSHSPMLLEAEVNVFPGTIAILAEAIVV